MKDRIKQELDFNYRTYKIVGREGLFVFLVEFCVCNFCTIKETISATEWIVEIQGKLYAIWFDGEFNVIEKGE